MENISVNIRIKPLLNNQDNGNKYLSLDQNDKFKSIINLKTNEKLTFDNIYNVEHNNKHIFDTLIKEKINSLLEGYNITIITYGQTSTGKTFTIRGNNKEKGIIPNSIEYLLNCIDNYKDSIKYEVTASYYEIYNENINDLLDIKNSNIELRDNSYYINKNTLVKETLIEKAVKAKITNIKEAEEILIKGDKNKKIAETNLNNKSSRSHTIFKIDVTTFDNTLNNNSYKKSTLNIIDLAGSENVYKANTNGMRLKEGSNINKSLLSLSNVIFKLSDYNKKYNESYISSNIKLKSNNNYINFRDSKLTRLLQYNLTGNSKTIIICNISLNNNCYSENWNTLNFASRAKCIKTIVKKNNIITTNNSFIKDKNVEEKENIKDKNSSSIIKQENTNLKIKIKDLENRLSMSSICKESNKHNNSFDIGYNSNFKDNKISTNFKYNYNNYSKIQMTDIIEDTNINNQNYNKNHDNKEKLYLLKSDKLKKTLENSFFNSLDIINNRIPTSYNDLASKYMYLNSQIMNKDIQIEELNKKLTFVVNEFEKLENEENKSKVLLNKEIEDIKNENNIILKLNTDLNMKLDSLRANIEIKVEVIKDLEAKLSESNKRISLLNEKSTKSIDKNSKHINSDSYDKNTLIKKEAVKYNSTNIYYKSLKSKINNKLILNNKQPQDLVNEYKVLFSENKELHSIIDELFVNIERIQEEIILKNSIISELKNIISSSCKNQNIDLLYTNYLHNNEDLRINFSALSSNRLINNYSNKLSLNTKTNNTCNNEIKNEGDKQLESGLNKEINDVKTSKFNLISEFSFNNNTLINGNISNNKLTPNNNGDSHTSNYNKNTNIFENVNITDIDINKTNNTSNSVISKSTKCKQSNISSNESILSLKNKNSKDKTVINNKYSNKCLDLKIKENSLLSKKRIIK